MSDAPLQPFPENTNLSYALPAGIDAHTVVTWLFYVVIVYWLGYSLIAAYHWVIYSHRSIVAIPAVAVHIVVSLALIGYIVSGLL
jgi:hypothetical protein